MAGPSLRFTFDPFGGDASAQVGVRIDVDGPVVVAEERNVVEAFDRVFVFVIPSIGVGIHQRSEEAVTWFLVDGLRRDRSNPLEHLPQSAAIRIGVPSPSEIRPLG